MEKERRDAPRFKVVFKILSNEIEGEGINISLKGFGVITSDELVPANNIPFRITFQNSKNNEKKLIIKGWAKLLYSKPINDKNEYYNGFEFISFEPKSKDTLLILLKDINDY